MVVVESVIRSGDSDGGGDGGVSNGPDRVPVMVEMSGAEGGW